MTSKFQLESQRAEHLRRMVTTWKADQPTDTDVASAFRRWGMRPSHKPGGRVSSMLLAGALGSAATLAAVELADALHREPDARTLTPSAEDWRSTSPAPTANAVGGVRQSESYLQQGGRRIAARDGLRADLDVDERAVVVVSGVRTELVGPGLVLLRADASAPGGWGTSFDRWETDESNTNDGPDKSARRQAAKKPSARHAVKAAGEAAGTDTSSGAWARVAQALRDHDSAKAERVLAELARSDDQRTRDGAELARAQLLVPDGRGAEARPALKRLAASGATAAIKSRAADLLAQIE